MKKSKIILFSLAQALAVLAYILLIAEIMSTMANLFANQPDKFLSPVAFLLLFVVSAAITGFLVLGKSATLYLEGLKREAIELFGYTIGWLVIIAAIVFVLLLNFR